MPSVASTAVRENDDRQPRKFTPENIAKIKDWVAQGIGLDEIANRLEVTVASLQVTCSRLGISLRRRALAKGNGPVQPHEDIRRRDHDAQLQLLIQTRNRQAAVDLRLGQDVIYQLALEAAVRGHTITDLIGKIVGQAMEKDLVGEILRNDNSPPKV